MRSRLTPPLSSDLAWMGRGRAHWPVAVACALPECSALVNRSQGGRQGIFHDPECGRRFRARRRALLAEAARLERLLDGDQVPGRRRIESDLRYVRIVLLTYPDLNKVPLAYR